MNEKMREWDVLKKTGITLQEIASKINPVLRGWINYYGKFYKTKLRNFMRIVNVKLANWARRKYKNLRAVRLTSNKMAARYLHAPAIPVCALGIT